MTHPVGTHHEVEQGTEEWHQLRIGSLTASRIFDALKQTKSGQWAASRKDYRTELVVERLTNASPHYFVSYEMQWGTDHEPDAAFFYGAVRQEHPQQCGVFEHPTIKHALASPDRLIGDDGLIEIKCPKSATHVDTLLNEYIPIEYQMQIDWQLACTGRKWCDFVSFDPRMPSHCRIYIERHHRNDAAIEAIENQVTGFLSEVAAEYDALMNRLDERRSKAA